MAAITLKNVTVQNANARITDPFVFEIEYDSLFDLKEDLQWNIKYISTGVGKELDEQELEMVDVGPVKVGSYKFVLQSNPIDVKRLVARDVGTNVILLTCSYRDKKFVCVGYYVSNKYEDSELNDSPPNSIVIAKLVRTVQTEKVSVTHTIISWDEESDEPEEVHPAGFDSLPSDVVADMLNSLIGCQ